HVATAHSQWPLGAGLLGGYAWMSMVLRPIFYVAFGVQDENASGAVNHPDVACISLRRGRAVALAPLSRSRRVGDCRGFATADADRSRDECQMEDCGAKRAVIADHCRRSRRCHCL